MRAISVLLFAGFAGAASAQSVYDQNFARPGGGYASVNAATPALCARACAEDSLCMSWTLVAETCELKAVIPGLVAQDGAVSGLSQRAPEWSRLIGAPMPAPAPAKEPESSQPASAPNPAAPQDARGAVEAAFAPEPAAPLHAAAQPDAYPSLLGGLQNAETTNIGDEPITLNAPQTKTNAHPEEAPKPELRPRLPSGRPSR